MQYISQEFKDLIAKKLKIGELSRPNCRVELDRLMFIPGRVETLNIDSFNYETVKRIEREWILPEEDGSYSGKTILVNEPITFPVAGGSLENVTSEFGNRNGSYHYGIDFALDYENYPEKNGVGTPIVAAWAGKVLAVSTSNLYDGYGKYIDIIHYNGLKTRYAHLDEIIVGVGDEVTAGQLIATGGNTGNVRANGRAVTGSYRDPNSQRSQGRGAHLHFEILEPIQSDIGNSKYKAVNPRKYFEGEKKSYVGIRHDGESVRREEAVEGYAGAIRLNETFSDRNWIDNPIYKPLNNFKILSSVDRLSIDDISNWNTTTFAPKTGKPVTTGFSILLDMPNEGYMSVGFRSSFLGEDGDSFSIRINNSEELSLRVVDFEGLAKLQTARDIYIPKGTVEIEFIIRWSGRGLVPFGARGGASMPKKFSLGFIKIQELEATTYKYKSIVSNEDFNDSTEVFTDIQNQGYWTVKEVEDFIFSKSQESFDLAVGNFVYMDTIVLENVENIDIAVSLDQETATATVLISNIDGYFSPSYNPYFFPELSSPSPFNYWAAGYQLGIISNNTPIRIYLGYGLNLLRVFTGLIDKADFDAAPPHITITARDMYKKISDKVLTETKKYPDIDMVENVLESTGDYRIDFINSIVTASINEYRIHNLLPSVTLAQAIHESNWGRSKIGNNIFGIKAGSNWTGKIKEVETQEYVNGEWVTITTVFRDYDSIKESVQDYGKLIGESSLYARVRNATNYKDACRELQNAGYATDPEYADKLINIIESNNLTIYDNKAYDSLPSISYTDEGFRIYDNEKVQWLKSAVIQDLVAHAGMFGWRCTADDLQYPDAIIEESYLISINQEEGTFIRAVPGEEMEFEVVKLSSVLTPKGWMIPYVESYGRVFEQYKYRVGECINEVLKDTNYRSYCDRYGTYRLETLDFNKGTDFEYTYLENIISVSKSEDFSRARSHIVVVDENGDMCSFIDKEILMELKGEIRSATVEVPWAKNYATKKLVATRLFQDMKRVCRTLQVATPGDPSIDVGDRVIIKDRNTATYGIFIVKGLRWSYSASSGFVQFLDLFWASDGTVV